MFHLRCAVESNLCGKSFSLRWRGSLLSAGLRGVRWLVPLLTGRSLTKAAVQDCEPCVGRLTVAFSASFLAALVTKVPLKGHSYTGAVCTSLCAHGQCVNDIQLVWL